MSILFHPDHYLLTHAAINTYLKIVIVAIFIGFFVQKVIDIQ